jgi:hypothetical protein
MEMTVDKTKVMRFSCEPSPLQVVTGQKKLDNVEYFKCLGSMITNDARCTRDTETRINMEKAFNRRKTLFTSKLDLNIRTKLVSATFGA